ncbi:MAG: class I SAM-dependent methyltransferase [Egibacteraceae bacterium]
MTATREQILQNLGCAEPPSRFRAFEKAVEWCERDGLVVVETGIGQTPSDGLSTVFWATCPAVARLISIDLDPTAYQRLLEAGLPNRPEYHQAHSLTVIAGLANDSVDLAYLDSDLDPTLMLHEFLCLVPKLKHGAVVLADDAETKGGPLARLIAGEFLPFQWAGYGCWAMDASIPDWHMMHLPETFGMFLFQFRGLKRFRCVRT